ncbi:MAG: hypothetical protein R6X25_14150 [Candidatus Krumholzibacteriia bacterium]
MKAAALGLVLQGAWVGFVVANALNARLKFDAPTLTRDAALDVGRHVFPVVLRVELVLALAVTALAVWASGWTGRRTLLAALAFATVLVQLFVLLPDLAERAAAVIAGGEPPASRAHLAYVVAEGLKLVVIGALVASTLGCLRPR